VLWPARCDAEQGYEKIHKREGHRREVSIVAYTRVPKFTFNTGCVRVPLE
jgi:hypothetical protein